MTDAIKPELVERMVALVRAVKERQPFASNGGWNDEARAIVAELPAPVDPDLVLAREVVCEDSLYTDLADSIRVGNVDNSHPVRIALAAIKRIRAELGE